MIKVFKTDEKLYIFSMGKKLRITAIATTVKEATIEMAKTDDVAVAEFEPFIFLAHTYDSGTAL